MFIEEENGYESIKSEQEEDSPSQVIVDEVRDEQSEDVPEQEEDVFEDADEAAGTDEPTLRRSSRERRSPDQYGEWVTLVDCQDDPQSVEEAMASEGAKHWEQAMIDEMNSIKANDVWKLVELPRTKKTIKTKWVFKVKRDDENKPVRFKARLVAKGFSQQHGLDYDETFSPVVRFETIRLLLAISAGGDLEVHQLDVKTAFLNGEIAEEIYVEQPEGHNFGESSRVYWTQTIIH